MGLRAKWKSDPAKRLLKMAPNAKTIEEAVRIVSSRLMADTKCPPTDLYQVAERLNISGFCKEDLPISGELRPDGKGFKIAYSSSLTNGPRRFTIAHEIAHAVFQSSGQRRPKASEELERLCDMFAAEILMPENVFIAACGAEISLQQIFRLADIFETSLTATAIRFSSLRKISAFEVEDDKILWGHGIVQKGSLDRVAYAVSAPLQEMVKNILLNVSELKSDFNQRRKPISIYLDNKSWKLDWVQLGSGSHLLCLLWLETAEASFLQDIQTVS